MRLEGLYDSHVHWLATGEVLAGLHLQSLQTIGDLKSLPIKPEHYRQDWLVGFGWDENHFKDLILDKKTLDAVFPDTPVFFSRIDGHSSWINSVGLKKLNRSELGTNGVLKEKDHIDALLSLPPYSKEQKVSFLKMAMKNFNGQGFTHIRDMGTTEDQFLCATEIDNRQELKLLVIHNFVCENLQDFDRALAEALRCKKMESRLLKVAGLKFFYDGSLGSETALLSIPYNGHPQGQKGLVNWKIEDLQEVVKRTWQQGLEVSIHTIGDEAAHQVVQMSRRIYSEGVSGNLNLEHVQILRPETIQAMKSLHVTCHMQPCHWLSDRRWLEKKITNLMKYAFPWEALRVAKVPLFFGSDSPIEPPSIFNNLKALRDSATQIKSFGDDPLNYHICSKWSLPDTFTIVSAEKIEEVVFCGQKII